MPIACQINFENNPQKIVFSGQKLHITVRMKLTEEMKIRRIYIQLRGMAHVSFVIDDCMCVSSYGQSGRYTTDETVLDMRKCLVDGNGHKNQLLPVGTHDYSLTCTLPSNLPSTFSGAYGDIKYTANVIVHRALWLKIKTEKICEEKFTVFKTVDLNVYPSLRAEVSHTETNTNWMFSSTSTGRIVLSAWMPTAGYLPGQDIQLLVSVDNESPNSLSHFVVCLMRKSIYKNSAYSVHHKTKNDIVQRHTFLNWKCESQTNEVFPVESVNVPLMIAPTDTETCKIIKINYFVSIKGFRSGTESIQGEAEISLDLPITIGTIPFGCFTSAMIAPGISAIPVAVDNDFSSSELLLMESSTAEDTNDDDLISIRTYTSTPPPFPDDDFDLPTYEEAILMDDEIDINLQSIEDSLAKLQVKLTE